MSTRKMIVTVDGTAYDVVVEMLDDAGSSDSTPIRMPAVSAARPAAVAAAPRPAAAAPQAAAGAGSVVAPLAGTVVTVHVKVGDTVSAGQTVITLEAMKMNTDITAPSAGTVKAVSAKEGGSVGEGQVLVEIG